MESLINHKYLRLYCEFLGILFIVFTLLFIIARFIIYLWLKYKARQFKWRGGPHTWAVITGCTEGIGLAYAEQLAAKGYNLLLISRNDEKLQKVKSDIEVKNKSARKVRTLAIDFFDTSDETYDKIDHMLDTLDEIHVLVNNVGTNYPNEKPEYMTKIPGLTHVIMSLINVNIVSCTRLTALVLPRMERRGRGVIINLSSFSALYPVPLLSLYSATKVYVDYMSRALQEEYRSSGIIIQSVMPFYVSTRMTYHMEPRFYAPTPHVFVKQALRTVGQEDRTGGFFIHRVWSLLWFWSAVFSRFIGIDIHIKMTYHRLKNIRARIMEKVIEEESGTGGGAGSAVPLTNGISHVV